MKKIFTPQEIARFLGVAPNTIYAELKRGKLCHHRIGRKYIITRQHLEDYLSPAVVQELLDIGEQDATLALAKGGARGEATTWLDAIAEDMAQGIAAAEQDVPEAELSEWFEAMEASVKPLVGNNG